MGTVVVIRPGTSDFDDQHRIQGALDLPLNECGESQLPGIVEAVRHLGLDAVYASSSNPARETAEALATALGCPLKECEDLTNMDLGLWQGLQFDELRRKFPKVYKQWAESPETICPPEGETVSAVLERLEKTLQKPLKKKGTIAIVASEPLATLIAASVSGKRPICVCPIVNVDLKELVQIIDTESHECTQLECTQTQSESRVSEHNEDSDAVLREAGVTIATGGDDSDEFRSKT